MSHPSGTAPLGDTEYWLTQQLLTKTDFTKKGLHNMMLKLKDPIERQSLMEAVQSKKEDSLCSMLPSMDAQKRITVKIVGQDYRMFAGELTYKLFRHSKAQKKKLAIKCEVNEEAVCVNPYHYQFKDDDDNDVPDELSDNEKFKMNKFAYFPVVDVNELPERKQSSDDDKDDDKDDDFNDTEHFFAGAAEALCSTALEEPDAKLPSPCTSCKEKDAKIAELEEELKKCKVEIATMKKSGETSEQQVKRQLPARAAKKN